MGIQFTEFRLYEYTSAQECVHKLLVRVNNPSYPNSDLGAENAAANFADSAADHLRTWWQRWLLPTECRREHESRLVLTAPDAVTEVLHGLGLCSLTIWAVDDYDDDLTLVAAATEDELNSQLREYFGPEDVLAFPRSPVAHDVYFITEQTGEGDLRDA